MKKIELQDAYISKFIVLSMYHISNATNSFLDDVVQEKRKVRNIGLKASYGFDDGYLVYVTNDWDKDETPDDLRTCICYAQRNECNWIYFSYCAEPIPVLDIYDPDEETNLHDLIINGQIIKCNINCKVENATLDEDEEWYSFDDDIDG